MSELKVAYIVKLNGKGKGSIEYLNPSLECWHIPTNVIWLVSNDDYSMQSAKCADCAQNIVRETAPVSAKYNWEDWRITK